ncbi:orexin receptor type 2-like [Lingula anatina]|uniref:Orexin receptor type 2-like n=1 Tax=Lingula anatina TaxID=7574 RepID=A0A1S3HH96_LINAN|nr:orexin receptor type 2-like [Lingula anatina]XP_013385402.1 orexin receptor type 2-like [Lingula anatina]|eukprot:XP_013385401.1 orexin receptor type 2-like [Lingula anatina]
MTTLNISVYGTLHLRKIACDALPRNPFSVEEYVLFALLAFFCVTGVVGNALVFVVYFKKRDRQTSTLFILTLAGTDFITCIANIPFTLVIEYYSSYIEYDVLCKLYKFLMTSSVPFSAFIMSAIAVDRYLCICHPLAHIMTLARAKMIIAGLVLLACIAGLVVSLCYGVYQACSVPSTTNVTNGTAFFQTFDTSVFNTSDAHLRPTSGLLDTLTLTWNKLLQTSERREEVEEIKYTGYCISNTLLLGDEVRTIYKYFHLGLYLTSLVIVLVLYSLLYMSVIERRRKRRRQRTEVVPSRLTATTNGNNGTSTTVLTTTEETEMNSIHCGNGEKIEFIPKVQRPILQRRQTLEKSRDRAANLKTAAMLFVVAVVFLISFLPGILITANIIEIPDSNLAKIFFYFFFINHVTNPVIYSFMNQNFRDDMRKILDC